MDTIHDSPRISRLIILANIILLTVAFIVIYRQYAELTTTQAELAVSKSQTQLLETSFTSLQKKAADESHRYVRVDNPTSKDDLIQAIIDTYTKNVNGEISVYYKNLTTNEKVSLNENEKYYMASLYKVILTEYMLGLIKSGTVKPTDLVDGKITVEQALTKIIEESNNEYAQYLANNYCLILKL
jgi:beta-lactamase class A